MPPVCLGRWRRRRGNSPPAGKRDPSAQAQRLTQLCAGAAFGIALLALAGWLFGARFLAGQWGGAIPMAPSTALAFLLLSGGVFSHARWPARRRSRYFTPVSIGLTALLGLLVLAQFIVGFDSGVERMLARTNELFGQIPLGRMSPLTAASFLLESGALMLVLRASRWRFADSMAALLAFTAAAINVVVLVGYAYGAPLLYGGATIPVALPTALAFVLLGAGQIRLALHGVPALRAWRGDSMRGMLLRAFLPVILLVIFLEGWMDLTLDGGVYESGVVGLADGIAVRCLNCGPERLDRPAHRRRIDRSTEALQKNRRSGGKTERIGNAAAGKGILTRGNRSGRKRRPYREGFHLRRRRAKFSISGRGRRAGTYYEYGPPNAPSDIASDV